MSNDILTPDVLKVLGDNLNGAAADLIKKRLNEHDMLKHELNRLTDELAEMRKDRNNLHENCNRMKEELSTHAEICNREEDLRRQDFALQVREMTIDMREAHANEIKATAGHTIDRVFGNNRFKYDRTTEGDVLQRGGQYPSGQYDNNGNPVMATGPDTVVRTANTVTDEGEH